MQSDQLHKLKDSLLIEEASLLRQLDESDIKSPSNESDPGTMDLERNLAVEEELKAKLHKTQKALENISNGKYGKCEECDQKIPLERLEAEPTSNMCLDCAAKLQ
jgi:DnaK suppressor protein